MDEQLCTSFDTKSIFYNPCARNCSTIVADVFAVLEKYGVKTPIGGSSKVFVAGIVNVSKLELNLDYALFCFGRHRTKEAQAALWTIEELLELLRLKNEYELMRLTMANDELDVSRMVFEMQEIESDDCQYFVCYSDLENILQNESK